jgi:hypothetical protein
MKNRSLKNFRFKFICLIIICAYLMTLGAHLIAASPENERFAFQKIQEIRTLQVRYAEKHQGNFAPNFDELYKTENSDEKLNGAQPIMKGYFFHMVIEKPNGQKPAFYLINADPEISEGPDKTGTRHFYFDSTLSAITFTTENRPASADDQSI